MQKPASFLAVDLGASNGRVMKVDWDGTRFVVDEVHRFLNWGIRKDRHVYWDVPELFSQVKIGMGKCGAAGVEPAGVAVDAWGVDYGLLDRRGNLLGNPHHYRDQRTEGIVETMRSVLSAAELFKITGVQSMAINTLYQLASVVAGESDELSRADTLLLIPDLFQYFLCGEKLAEYTEATTTQLVYPASHRWASEVLSQFQIPANIFPAICRPGTKLGPMNRLIAESCGFSQAPPCIAIASHDTASAVAAIPSLDGNSIFLSSGTWSLMGVLSDQPDTSDEAFRLGFTNEGSAEGGVLLLKNLCGLWILQECQRCWDRPEEANNWALIARAAETVTPFRSLIDPAAPEFQNPVSMLDAIRTYCADSDQPVPETLGQFARCALESLALLYRRTVDDLRRLTVRRFSAIRIVGGGAMNHLLCQMTADACQMEVVAGPMEAAALGNAMLQAIATGHLRGFEQGHLALQNSVQRTFYIPKRDDRWELALNQSEVYSDRIRNARLRSNLQSTAILSR